MFAAADPVRDTPAELPLARGLNDVNVLPEVRFRARRYGRQSEIIRADFTVSSDWTIRSAMAQFRKAARQRWQNGQNRFPHEVIIKGSILLTTARPNGNPDKLAIWMPAGQELINP